MNSITVLKNNAPTGPFTRAQIAEKLQSGEITPTDLAFADGLGLAQWVPLSEVLAKVDVGTVNPPAPPVVAPATIAPGYSYAATMAPPSHLAYGGFWIRFVAYFIDGLIIGTVVFIIVFVISLIFIAIGAAMGLTLHGTSTDNSANPLTVVLIAIMEIMIYGVAIVLTWLYFAKLESGPAQATYGKRVMGLRVTDVSGQRITFGRASGRFFGKIVSGMTFYIGFIMAGFTERKQALHDMIAGTLVIKG